MRFVRAQPVRVGSAFLCIGLVFLLPWWVRAGLGSPARVSATRARSMQPAGGMPRYLFCPLWRTDGQFVSTLHVKNSLVVAPLAVSPTIYMSDGMLYMLPSIVLPPAGAATVKLADLLAELPLSAQRSQWGSLQLQYTWPSDNHLLAEVFMTDARDSLSFHQPCMMGPMPGGMGTADSAEASSAAGSAAIQDGLWWRRDPSVGGFVTVTNATDRAIVAEITVTGSHGAALAPVPFELAPRALWRMNLLDAVNRLPPGQQGAGGIRLEYSGQPGELIAAGGLENRQVGFSANILFWRQADALRPGKPSHYDAAGLLVGQPLAEQGFPTATRFTPYLFLRNTTARPIRASVSLAATAGSGTTRASLPSMILAANWAGRVNLRPALARLAPPERGGMVNLDVGFTGRHGDVLIATGSVDQSGTYVFEVLPMEAGPEVGLESSAWSTAAGNDTMVTIWNPSAQAQNAVLTLYGSDGSHYKVPLNLAAGAATMVDVAELEKAGQPDAQGNVLGPSTTGGGLTVRPAGFDPDLATNGQAKGPITTMNLAVSVGIFNVRDGTCIGPCCCCCSETNFEISLATAIFFGANTPATASAQDCSGVTVDDTTNASFSSQAPAVASISGHNTVNGAGPGSTSVSAQDFLNAVITSQSDCYSGCPQQKMQASGPIEVQPEITSISPDAVLVGSSNAPVTISGVGFGASPSLNLPGGFSATNVQSNGSSITLNLSVATSANLGNNAISITASGATSNTSNFIADYPTHVLVEIDRTQHCQGCLTTLQRVVTYQAVTFASQVAANIQIGELPTIGNWGCTSPPSGSASVNYTPCPSSLYTDANGEFSDTWGFSGDNVSPSGCSVQITSDHYEWCTLDKTFATLSGSITAGAITMNGYTNPPNSFPTLFSIGP